MQKISLKVFEKLIEQDATSGEIDFLLYVARFQNDCGHINGVYYKDVCTNIGISHQAFYDIKRSLESKGIIQCEKRNYFDWDIEILDNNFSVYTKEDYENKRVKYISINRKMYTQKNFKKLKAKEKLMAMYFLNICLAGSKECHEIGVKRLWEEYPKKFGVSKKSIRGYFTMLRLFFSIGIKDGKYYITARKYFKEKSQEENKDYRGNIITVGLRRNKIASAGKKERQETEKVLNIYGNEIKQAEQWGGFSLSQIISKSLEIINEGRKNKKKWIRKLQPSLINQLMKKEYRTA